MDQSPGRNQHGAARRIRLEAPTVGRHIERLHAAGWVDRRVLVRLKRLGDQMREEDLAGIPPAPPGAIIDLLVPRQNLLAARSRAEDRISLPATSTALSAAR